MIEVQFENLPSVRGRFRNAVRAVVKARAVEDITRIAARAIREEAPEGRTNRLASGIYGEVVSVTRDSFLSFVKSSAHYTRWVIEGRGWVYPVRAKVLHWVTKGGEDVFSMYARPTEPNPFHERGWERARPRVEERWTMAAHGIVRTLAD